jgi:hypothetical protein
MIRLIAAVALLIGWSSVARAGAVVVDAAHEAVAVGAAMEIAYDPGASLGFAEVQGGALAFAPAPREVPSFGYREGVEWARFTLDDRRASPGDLVLEQGQGDVLPAGGAAVDCQPAIDALERGRFEQVLASLHDVPQVDPLVSLLRTSAEARVSEHLLR